MNGLAITAKLIDGLSNFVGKYISWLALVMVIIQFSVVLARYVFGLGSVAAQESIIYSHALLFMLGGSFTLLHNGHVRVDIFYASATPRTKAIVDLVGSLCLLIPVMTAIMVLSWEYVANSWAILEVSRENSGIHFVYGLKTIILIFCGMMILQGISTICHSILFLNGRENRFQDDEMPEVL